MDKLTKRVILLRTAAADIGDFKFYPACSDSDITIDIEILKYWGLIQPAVKHFRWHVCTLQNSDIYIYNGRGAKFQVISWFQVLCILQLAKIEKLTANHRHVCTEIYAPKPTFLVHLQFVENFIVCSHNFPNPPHLIFAPLRACMYTEIRSYINYQGEPPICSKLYCCQVWVP